jgi:hypothetical protein
MEEERNRLIALVDKYRKIELWSLLLKAIPVLIYILIAPVVIWLQIIDEHFFTALILSLAEVLLLFKLKSYYHSIMQHINLKDCLLYQSVLHPEKVNEIFVYPNHISIDIDEAENYIVYVKDGDLKVEFINYFRNHFGEKKIFFK